MGHQLEPRIEHAAIHRVIIAGARGQGGFLVVDEGVHREIAQPFVNVHPLAHGLDIVGIRRVGAEDVNQIDEVRPVIGSHVALFLVGTGTGGGAVRVIIHPVGIRVGSAINQIGVGSKLSAVKPRFALVNIAAGIQWIMVRRPVAIERFEAVVGAELGGTRRRQVVAIDAHLHRRAIGRGHAGGGENDVAGRL